MSNTKILIASTLKPLDDIRSYRKIACSLSKIGDFDISVIGTKNLIEKPRNHRINEIKIKLSGRLSASRIFLPLLVLVKIWRYKPDVLIITTHELLLPSFILKIISSIRIIYDVQENYYKNLMFQREYLPPFNWILAYFIRFKELLSRQFVDFYFLAEKCYATELKFTRKKNIILENKSLAFPPGKVRNYNSQIPCLLFTGTISNHSGIEYITNFVNAFRSAGIDFKLKVIGQYHTSSVYDQLMQLSKYPEVEMQVSKNQINYDIIVKSLGETTIGLVCYQLNKANQDRIPTKVFEYLLAGIPILSQIGSKWNQLISEYGIVLPMDFEAIDTDKVMSWINDLPESFQIENKKELLWESEEAKLFQFMEKFNS